MLAHDSLATQILRFAQDDMATVQDDMATVQDDMATVQDDMRTLSILVV